MCMSYNVLLVCHLMHVTYYIAGVSACCCLRFCLQRLRAELEAEREGRQVAEAGLRAAEGELREGERLRGEVELLRGELVGVERRHGSKLAELKDLLHSEVQRYELTKRCGAVFFEDVF